MTGSPSWLMVTWRMRAMPRAGRDAGMRRSAMSGTKPRVSAGRTGRGNCTSPMPGEPRLQARNTPCETQLQGHRHGVQARRDQPAEGPLLGELDIGVERLRIPLSRELDDACFGHGHAAAHEPLADAKILEIAIAHRNCSLPTSCRRLCRV